MTGQLNGIRTSPVPGLALLSSEKVLFCEGSKGAVANHYVVENPDAHEVGGLAQSLGDRLVLGGRLGVSRRVVVREDQCRGVRDDRGVGEVA